MSAGTSLPCDPAAVDDFYGITEVEVLVVDGSGVLINDIPCDFPVAFGAASAGTFNAAPPGFTFQPDPGFTGEVTVPYSLAGSEPLVSAVVHIQVIAAPLRPPCDRLARWAGGRHPKVSRRPSQP